MSSVVQCRGGYAPSQMKTTVNTQLFLPHLPCSRIEPCRNSVFFFFPFAHVKTQPEAPPWRMREAGKKKKENLLTTPRKQGLLDPILSDHQPSRAQLHATPPTAKLWSTTLPFTWIAPAPQKNITFSKRGQRQTRKRVTAFDKTQCNCITLNQAITLRFHVQQSLKGHLKSCIMLSK